MERFPRRTVRARARFSSKSAHFHGTAEEKSLRLNGQKRSGPTSYVSLVHRGERIRVIGRHHYLVKSGSEKGVWHAVDLGYVNEEWPEGGCTCDGFSARKTCRHFRVVLDLHGLPDLGPMDAEID